MKTNRLFKLISAMVLVLGLMFMPATDIPILKNFVITASAAVSYSISADGKTLYINGSGEATTDYTDSNYTTAPWRQDSRYSSVTNIVIGSGITRIGSRGFYNSSNIKSITITGTTKIGQEAFKYCDALETVNISKNAKSDGSQIFGSCKSIKTVNIIDGDGSEWNTIVNGFTYNNDYFIDATRKYVRTITFDANGGSGTMDAQYAEYNKAFTLPSCGFTNPAGKVFKCWSVDGAEKAVGATITITGSKTVTAVWVDDEYTISFNSNGGSTTPTAQKTSGKKLTSLPSAGTKTGYNFDGWYTAQTNGTKITTSSTFSSGTTLWAHWTPASYTVTYNGNGSTGGSTTNSTHTYDTAKNLTANGFERKYTITYDANGGSACTANTAAYTFSKWNTAANGSGTSYNNSASVTNLAASGTVTLYAQWNSASVTLPTPTRTGYTFGGWYSGSTLIGMGGASYTPTANTTLTAKWTANTYTVTLNTNDGTINAGNITSYTYGTGATLPTDVTKTKYTFGGWYDNDACTGTAITAISTTDIGEKTFYAKWEENRMSDSEVKLSDKTVTYDGSAQSLNAPTNTLGATIKYGTTEGTYDLNSIPAYTDAGTYTIYYKASKDTYFDKTGSATLTINPQKLTKPNASNTDKTYSGVLQGPTIEGYDNSTMTQAGTASATAKGDYSITWSLKDTHNYRWSDDSTAEVTVSWKINAKPITDSDIGITLSQNEYIYDGEMKNPEVTVADSGGGTSTTLEKGKDYTCSYENNKNAGTATVTIEGIGNYTGTTSKEFTIKKQEVNIPGAGTSAEIRLSQYSYEFNGNYCSPDVDVVDNNGKTIPTEEYTITYDNNLNAGTAKVIINNKDDGNYVVNGYKTFEINQKTLLPSDVTVMSIADIIYTGSEIRPGVTLKYGDKEIPSSEYDVAYSGNTNVGTATITITNKTGGNYNISETVTAEFNITAAAITGITAAGYEVTYDGENHSITVSGTQSGDTIKYSKDSGQTYIDTNPVFIDAGEHTVHYKVIRANHSDFTGTATVIIAPKDVTISGVRAENKTYDGTDSASVTGTPVISDLITSDEGKVSVSVGTAAFENKNAGDNKTVTFTGFTLSGEKVGNYNLMSQPGSVTAKISEAPVTFTWKDEDFIYNGNPQKPGLISVTGIVRGDDCSVTVGGDQTNAGIDYTATASLTGTDAGNYILSGETSRSFTIAPKELTDDMVTLGTTDNTYVFTGSTITPDVTVSDNAGITADDYTIGGTTGAEAFGSYELTVTGKRNYTGEITVTWRISDPNPPMGSITVSTNNWKSFLNTITFGLFFKETQTVTITGKDGSGESGVDKLYYYLSGTGFGSENELTDTADWTELSANGDTEKVGSFSIDPDKKLIIYAKITDKSGNTTYINSDGIIFDATAPSIVGVTNGLSYCEEKIVTISDDNLDNVTVNGSVVTLNNGKYTLVADGTEYMVIASDKAGNRTTVTAKVNNGHTESEAVEKNRVEATCTEDGSYEMAVYCRICGIELSRESYTIEKTGHSLGEWVEVKSPNCTDKGSKKRSCTICGYTETEDVDAAGHSFKSSYTIDKAATCTEDGSRSVHCSNCDTVKDSETIPKTGHAPVTDAAKAPTCTETGLTEGSHCSVCNAVLKEQTIVTATGHTAGETKEENRRESTCTDDGSYDTVVYCRVCSTELNRDTHTVGKTGHEYGSSWGKDANGHWKECSRCGAKGQTGNHVYDNDSDATCNVCGYTRTVNKPANNNPDSTGGQPTNQDKPVNSKDKDKQTPNTGSSDNKNKQTENKDKQQNSDKQTILVEKDDDALVITGEKTVTGNVPEAESKETTLDAGKGKVVVTVVCEDEDYTAGVADTVTVANAVLIPEQIQRTQNGETVEIRVDVKDISEDIPASEKEAMEEFIELQNEIPGLQVKMYIDISIYIKVGNADWDSVTQTRKPIDVVIGIPEKLQGEGRRFYIVRSHEGGITLLYDNDNADDTITVRTSQFSDYAIAYTEADLNTDAEMDTEAYTRGDGQTDEETKIVADTGIDTAAIELALHSEANKCSLCHICPTFLGLCCFIWLAIAILVATAIVVACVVIMKRRKTR